ncbi:hypothetical protein HBO32_09965 [Pseudomonas nitroreducens]|uniref:hypothetical protein n=1 Tax=Pseudomonas nitroreducens TaxID=46680 RepID=UPI00147448BA|nr:hypothetical protein [Pseudomonas nitroreducens]NMZ73424.1 hypothetical protein [Pseudomonas nitroreducens]
MARQPRTIDAPAEPEHLDQAALLEHQHQVARLTNEQDATVRAIAVQLGYQLPADCTDPDLIQRDIATNMRRSVEACLEVGRGLQVLKAACPHGDFVARLDSLGMERTVAHRFMTAAVKFSSGKSKPLLAAIDSQTKLFEMLVLDDEQLEELELTGQTGELTLDDISTMSVKELRRALRDSRDSIEAKDRVLADKSAKITSLETALAKKPKVIVVQPEEEAIQLRQEVVAEAYEVEGRLQGTLRKAFTDLAELGARTGEDHRAFKASLVRNLEVTLMAIRSEFHLPELHPDELPTWHKLLGLDEMAEG